ncbi:IclR family transcriptional regulator [Actinomycetospora termitidis]|uniref:IclR family transcriptional regulator C-terminal domain-containing protein n=1 Tax=Actinomycetospora termitidis TaxID=3053470 RepID=A0ABT7M7K9_9PSEU|nr:IclR family transcriptional regulator C-terminal domain-containing protein [Actinomycetospora sp. Odt1-22]MDL5156664.1 IclR family transcriptional regulator C-terminal domain-containing protein [Actinomycetospora sp. Odt1-22]
MTTATPPGMLRALRLFAANPDGLDLRRAGRHLGRAAEAARESVDALVAGGYVEQTPTGSYRMRPGPSGGDGPVRRASEVPTMLADAVTELHRRTRARAYLAEWTDDDHVDLLDARGHERLARIPELPARVPPSMAHAVAAAKVLMAFSSARRSRLEGGTWTRFTASTITDPTTLDVELAAIRRDGYALDREEFAEGFSCVAAPVADPGGRVAACLAVSMPTRQLATCHAETVRAVTEVARTAHRLWYR